MFLTLKRALFRVFRASPPPPNLFLSTRSRLSTLVFDVFFAAKSKTRVWASSPTPPQKISQSGPLSSTSHWGSTFCSYEIAVERLVGKYYPYGVEIQQPPPANGTDKFATYFRDSETGLDYANNRYHQPGMGRFMSPDPYAASGGPSEPGSWNRYAYTRGDPVNRGDPSGLDDQEAQCAAIENAPGFIQGFNGGAVQQCADLYPDGAGSEQGGGAFYDPNPSTFANDLGSATSDNLLDFSSAYDLNNGAPGFGPDPGVPPSQPDCQGPILNAVNNQFGTNFTDANVQSTFTNGGGFNLVINGTGLSASQFNSIQTGRYASGFLNAITGVGPSLHLPAYDAVNDPNAIFNNSNIGGMTSVTFTAHTDSAFAYNPLGALLHYILDVSDQGKATRNPCP